LAALVASFLARLDPKDLIEEETVVSLRPGEPTALRATVILLYPDSEGDWQREEPLTLHWDPQL
jgi:hypothetical protein